MGPELAYHEALLRLLLASALAGLIGLERERREQEAGLRTHMLVGIGACLFVIGGNYGWGDLRFGNNVGVVLDPARVTAYVVTGIGFLGAGAIIKHGINVRGLTTAASLWVVAAIGTTSGAGLYWWALTATGIVLASLWPLRKFASVAGWRTKGAQRLAIELDRRASVARVLAVLEERGVEVESARVGEEEDRRRLDVVLRGRDPLLGEVLDAIAGVEGVRASSWAP